MRSSCGGRSCFSRSADTAPPTIPDTMPSRDEILDELGLGPRWRLRVAREPGVGVGAAQTQHSPAAPKGEPSSREARIAALEWRDFAADVDACTACGLYRGRKKSVPGVGDPNADWLFVGEGPGAEEDAKGEPFVGQAGKLLDSMLAALGLARGANVYIANVVKCRPPGNRTPEPAEAAACRALSRPPDRAFAPARHRCAGKERRHDAARCRRHDWQPARTRAPL